jgi:hypothetical protein
MNSLFYDAHYLRPFPFTLLLLERIETLHNRGDLGIEPVLKELCDVPDGEMEGALDYVDARLSKYAGSSPAATRGRTIKSLGHALTSMLKDLPLADMLITAFGLAEARRLYCEEDMDDALHALKLWQAEQAGRHSMLFEAVMYGFGGKYRDDGQQTAPTIDMTTDDGFDALKSFAQQVNGVFH